MIEDIREARKEDSIELFVVKGNDVQLILDKSEKTSKGGIIFDIGTGREKEGIERGVIAQMGASAFEHLEPEERYKVGDKVVITRYAGKYLGIDADELTRVKVCDTDIHALVLDS